MHYIAWRIGEGAVPYRDLFDMNFPGVYLIHLASFRLFGAGDAGWRVFDLAWLAATSLAAAALAAPWGRLAAVGAALFFAVYHLAGGAWQTGQRDFLLCPLLLLAALGVSRWVERPGDRSSPVWGGLARGAGRALSACSVLARRRVTGRHTVVALGLLYGLVHFVGQGKGWEYHLYPLAAFAAVALFAEAGRRLDARSIVALPLLACAAVAA